MHEMIDQVILLLIYADLLTEHVRSVVASQALPACATAGIVPWQA